MPSIADGFGVRYSETHISWVLLTGEFAYKIKKPVNFGFLDFSTLEKRRHYCEEEFRLNKVSAEPLYVGVVPIYGSTESPSFTPKDKTDQPIEYAVKMREFPQKALLVNSLQNLKIKEMADYLADFHQQCAVAKPDTTYGDPDITVYPVMQDNFSDIERRRSDKMILALNKQIKTWSVNEYNQLMPLLKMRKAKGFIRQCHGDLHLGNMVYLDNTVYCFDRLEFNPEFQWIDTLYDLAFLLMDLEYRGYPDLSFALLNQYLNQTRDYDGLPLLIFYKVMRAMIRAKIRLLINPPQPDKTLAYLQYVLTLVNPPKPQLILTHGFSGSGKSTKSAELAPSLSCVILRTDVYRDKNDPDRYQPEKREAVYTKLADLTEVLLKQGQSVLVDATFLKQSDRARFIALAEKLQIPWKILDFSVPKDTLVKRLSESPGSEATLSVLEQQMATHEPLTKTEQEHIWVMHEKK